jgi:hypothetical protein
MGKQDKDSRLGRVGHLIFFFHTIVLSNGNHLFPFVVNALSSQSTNSSNSIRQLAKNWFSIAEHLQDPTLYSAEWANGCEYRHKDRTLVTSRNVQEGEILSLLAIHAIGIEKEKYTEIEEAEDDQKDWVVFDATKDSDYFFPSKNKKKRSIYSQKGFQRQQPSKNLKPPQQSPYRYYLSAEMTRCYPSELQGQVIFCDVNPTRSEQAGWMGHLAATASADIDNNTENSIIVPISVPLYALVATREILKGAPLFQRKISDFSTAGVMRRYRNEIGELRGYMDMAYPKPPTLEEECIYDKEERGQRSTSKSSHQLRRFYDFPRDHLNLHVLHQEPDIFSIPNFLTESECDRLIQKAQPHLISCVTKNPKTGAVERDSSRTSRNTNVPQTEVPTIIEKLTQLANCKAENLEVLQVLNYASGQYFNSHTDGFSGPITACGFEQSARLVTIFVYLNDVEEGGETRFSQLDIDVKPQKGTAVVHFPTTLDFQEDSRTEHQGVVAVDEKWLLVTWVWMHPRDQNSLYAEKYLDTLGVDTI